MPTRRPPAILVDIDSTLYDADPVYLRYFDRLFGVKVEPHDLLDYNFWGGRLTSEQFDEVITWLHCEEEILGAVPYPGAVEALRMWAAAGVDIHIVSDRKPHTRAATVRWLDAWQIPRVATVLEHRFDKLAYAQAHDIGLVIDDKPRFIEASLAVGIVPATILHAYNRGLVAADARIIGADDWTDLSRLIEPVLFGNEASLRGGSRTT
jgi:uncharacterized HAD superfamily protein